MTNNLPDLIAQFKTLTGQYIKALREQEIARLDAQTLDKEMASRWQATWRVTDDINKRRVEARNRLMEAIRKQA